MCSTVILKVAGLYLFHDVEQWYQCPTEMRTVFFKYNPCSQVQNSYLYQARHIFVFSSLLPLQSIPACLPNLCLASAFSSQFLTKLFAATHLTLQYGTFHTRLGLQMEYSLAVHNYSLPKQTQLKDPLKRPNFSAHLSTKRFKRIRHVPPRRRELFRYLRKHLI